MKKYFVLLLTSFILFTGCYSVFSGGTGGTVVDSESMSTPKTGIANVDVYAYTENSFRDSDYNSWKSAPEKTFKSKAEYYGHTTTGADGSWSISKLVWKENSFKSSFGKDADYQKIYLIFYHPDYGCTKGETIIMSDSFSDYIYTELTTIVKRSAVTLNFVDVATDSNTTHSVAYEILVPQATETNKNAEPVLYRGIAAGTATVTIRYPRYKDENNTENTPEIQVKYFQNLEKDEIEWKACKNDIQNNDCEFIDTKTQGITKTVTGSGSIFYFYGKKTKLSMPSFSGIYGNTNGIEITLKLNDKIDCGSVTTGKRLISSDTTEDGFFSGLGAGYYWLDDEYKGRFAETEVYFYKGNGENKAPLKILEGTNKKNSLTVRSDKANYEIVLSD